MPDIDPATITMTVSGLSFDKMCKLLAMTKQSFVPLVLESGVVARGRYAHNAGAHSGLLTRVMIGIFALA